jgi:hypothetical protein
MSPEERGFEEWPTEFSSPDAKLQLRKSTAQPSDAVRAFSPQSKKVHF